MYKLSPLLIISLIAGILTLLLTRYGPGLRDDSYTYLSAAEMISKSGMYARPSALGDPNVVTNFPPLYSLSIAALDYAGVQLFTAVRILNALLFTTLVFCTGYVIFSITRQRSMTLFAGALVLTSIVLTKQYTWAQSEPLFLSLLLLGFLFLFRFMRSHEDRIFLYAASGVIALTSLTRYAGLVFVVAMGLSILSLSSEKLRQRVLDALLFMLCASIPLLIFLVRNILLTGNATNRPEPFWHPPDPQTWLAGMRETLMWFLPDRVVLNMNTALMGTILVGALVLLGLLVFGVDWARYAANDKPEINNASIWLKVIFINLIAYLLFMLVTVNYLDVLTPLDDRILSPVYLLLILMIISLGYLLSKRHDRAGILLVYPFLIVLLGFQIYRYAHLYQALRADGQGYSETTWRQSETLEYVCDLPQVPLYSNDLPAIYFHCDRLAKPLPAPLNLASLTPNPDYPFELDRMRNDLLKNRGYLVILGWYGEARLDRLGITEVVEELGVDRTFDDGLVLSH